MWVPMFAASGLVPLAMATAAGIEGGEKSNAACIACKKLMKQLGIQDRSPRDMRRDIEAFVDFLKMYKDEPKLQRAHSVKEWRLIQEQVELCKSSLCEDDSAQFMREALVLAERGGDSRVEFLGGGARFDDIENDNTAVTGLLEALSDESSDYSVVI